MRLWPAILLLVAAVIVSGCSIGPTASAPTPEPWTPPPTATVPPPTATAALAPTAIPKPTAIPRQTFTVQRGTVVDELKFSGRVAPVQQQDLTFAQDGILKTIMVERSAVVKKGQLLAELDMGDLRDQLRAAQVSAGQDRVALDKVNQQARIAAQRAQVDLDAAKAKLEKLQNPPSADDLAKAQAAIQQAQAALDKTRNDASAVKTQAEQEYKQAIQTLTIAQAEYGAAYNAVEASNDDANNARLAEAAAKLRTAEDLVARTKITYDTARGNEIAAIQNAEAAVAVAKSSYDQLLKGPDPFAIGEAQREVQIATLALEDARQRARSDTDLTKQIAASELEVRRLTTQIEARRLYAPFDGTVAVVSASPGFAVQVGVPIMTLINASGLQVLVENVGDKEATRLKVGQAVEISFPRYSGQTFSGAITRLPLNTGAVLSANSADSAYQITYDAKGLELSIGDSADVVIRLDQKENTLWLPVEAITTGDRPFVMAPDGDSDKRIDVRVGLITPERVEILEGLKEGDVVFGK